jgi:Transposase DDE domain group 1
LLLAELRPSNIDASAGAKEEIAFIVAQIRDSWPNVDIWLRADSGFCHEELMAWCEAHGGHYVFGLARNALPPAGLVTGAHHQCSETGEGYQHKTI